MKKFTFAAIAAVAAIMISSCGNGTPKANLKSDIDTMSYAIGMAQTQGLKEYLVGSMDVDTTYMAEFIKGLNEGANAGDNKKKAAYYAGIQIGQQISNRMVKGINFQLFGDDSTKTISLKNFMAGFVAATTGKKGLMTVDSAQVIAERLMREIKAKQMEKTYGPNKEAGEKFLAENAKKEGVKTLPSGVQYKVIKEGNGAIPTDTSVVKVNYEGRLQIIQGYFFEGVPKYAVNRCRLPNLPGTVHHNTGKRFTDLQYHGFTVTGHIHAHFSFFLSWIRCCWVRNW